jgi:hypothetical protein
MGSFPSGAKGRARVDPRRPAAYAICDRTGFRVQHNTLVWNFEWRGASLQNERILVRPQSNDKPNPQLRAYAPPPDPLPIMNPRPDKSDMVSSYTPYLTDEYGNLVTDEFGHPMVISQPVGTSQAPLPLVSSLIPLRDDSGNIIVGDDGQPILVEGAGAAGGTGGGPTPPTPPTPPGTTPSADFSQPDNTQYIPVIFP